MSHSHKLSLRSSIFININIMLGSGIFINSIFLAKKAGILGATCYPIIGILMLPLIISMSTLLTLHPSGGFYIFGAKEISPFAGFLSGWSYATGKLASSVIVTQIAVLLIQNAIPALSSTNPLYLNMGLLFLFMILNMFDIKTNSIIQSCFFGLKSIPILFAIFAGFYLFSCDNIPLGKMTLIDIPIALPLVLFAISGFEAACSLSSRIEDAHKNAPRAIFISYAIVITITTLFQLMIYGGLGDQLTNLPDYRHLFPTLVSNLFPTLTLSNFLSRILHIAIAISAIGGSYGIIFSNSWNFYTLAQHKHLLFSSHLIKLNRFHIPWRCVLIEGFIYTLFLYISQGTQIPLQQTGALGPTIAYAISIIALFCAAKNNNHLKSSKKIALLAGISCLLLICSCIYGLINYGISSLFTFIGLLFFGVLMFFIQKSLSQLNGQQSTNT